MLRMTPQRMGGTAILFLAALIGTGSLLHPVGESKQVIADQGVYRFPGLAVLMTDPDSA